MVQGVLHKQTLHIHEAGMLRSLPARVCPDYRTNKAVEVKACWHFKTFPVTSHRIMAAGSILP